MENSTVPTSQKKRRRNDLYEENDVKPIAKRARREASPPESTRFRKPVNHADPVEGNSSEPHLDKKRSNSEMDKGFPSVNHAVQQVTRRQSARLQSDLQSNADYSTRHTRMVKDNNVSPNQSSQLAPRRSSRIAEIQRRLNITITTPATSAHLLTPPSSTPPRKPNTNASAKTAKRGRPKTSGRSHISKTQRISKTKG
jgi:hypothetical protein